MFLTINICFLIVTGTFVDRQRLILQIITPFSKKEKNNEKNLKNRGFTH